MENTEKRRTNIQMCMCVCAQHYRTLPFVFRFGLRFACKRLRTGRRMRKICHHTKDECGLFYVR